MSNPNWQKGLHRHSWHSLPVKGKEQKQCILSKQGPFCTLLLFNCWHHQQPASALIRPNRTHTPRHTRVCNKDEFDASDADNSQVKARVVKRWRSRQLLLLAHSDCYITHWMKALHLVLPLILLLEDGDRVSQPMLRHRRRVNKLSRSFTCTKEKKTLTHIHHSNL